MDRENAPFFTQGARSRVSFGAAHGLRLFDRKIFRNPAGIAFGGASESRLFDRKILRNPAGIAFGAARGPRRAGQKSLPALCNLLPCKTEL